ncbi:MAG: hypothetical protein K2N39_04975 [Lachnospiraceae bacterium]|nr:hypothetical protein [Lachnospiraceae bacterium]MDE7358776.1 hypothetical protein [Lachnospiraceae bacterium]
MKKFLALSLALAFAFSSSVCAAETVVPEDRFPELDTLAATVGKTLPEYTSNAVSGHHAIFEDWSGKISDIASGSDMFIAGEETNATCVVDKVDYQTALYALKKGAEVGGQALVAAKLSAPGVNLADAQVKLYVEDVAAGDAISVYKCVKGEWEPVAVTSVTDGYVQVAFDYQGIYAVIKTEPVK